VSGITLDSSSATLFEGDSLLLTATVSPLEASDPSVSWISSDPSVATVDSVGLVHALSPGTARIAASAGDTSAVCVVTVERRFIAVSGIALDSSSATLVEGDSLLLTATVSPLEASDPSVSWISSDPSVATVDSVGLVHALSPGTARITASAGDTSAVCVVTVLLSGNIDVNIIVNKQFLIYDVKGRSVLDTENLKGSIYIVNGRKILIK